MKKPVVLTIILTVFLLVVGVIWYLFSTGLSIDGTILDSVEKKPLAQVTVKINKNSYFSNKDGKFEAKVPIAPPAKLIIEKNGYKSFVKAIDFKSLQANRKYEIFLEPLTFSTLLDTARKDLLSYTSYTFRYNWKNRIGEQDQTNSYMVYEVNPQSILHFKFLQDDRFGNMISSREIIKSKDQIYYKDAFSPAWMKINEKDISSSKLQEPYDILQILQDETEPTSFIYEGSDIIFFDSLGKIMLKDELPINSKDSQGKEIIYPSINVNIYTAKWNRPEGIREVKFYLDNKSYRLYKGTLTDESPEKIKSDELGKIIKQNLSFTISNINTPIEIKIPEI